MYKQEGGSWEVRVSLAAVGQWVRSLGRLTPGEAFGKGLPFPPRILPQDREISELAVVWPRAKVSHKAGEVGGALGAHTGITEVRALRQAAILSATPAKEGEEGEAPVGLCVHDPVWLSRRA